MNEKIAVIGGGIAGLTAAYLLNTRYQVTLLEKSNRIGGNAYSLTTDDGQEVDIAAAVFGHHSYKNLSRLFQKVHVKTEPAFRFTCLPSSTPGANFYDLDSKKGIFLTPGIRGLFSQRFALLKPGQIRSILQLMRGFQTAQSLYQRGELKGLTIEEALRKIPDLEGNTKLIFLCCLCLISSMHCDAVLDAPADFFIQKLRAYPDFMPPRALFSTRLARKGTRSYVAALSESYREKIMLNAQISEVRRNGNRVTVVLEDGREIGFDKVVFACNADQALRMLKEPTTEEKRLLGSWKYTEGKVVVHRDHSYFPTRSLMEGYTFLYRKTKRCLETSVSGSLWVLPGVSKDTDIISTQHPNFPIRQERILFEKIFRTPLFDFNSCATVHQLPSLNGPHNTYYCGSHFGFGLHEDAVTSAIDVAKQLGVEF